MKKIELTTGSFEQPMKPIDFIPFPKIPRLSREITVTEKLDGTSGTIFIEPIPTLLEMIDGGRYPLAVANGFNIHAGSRNRWLSRESDNYSFAAWVQDNAEELVRLGPGWHRGEWWGWGIQRGYSQTEKRFSLFNTGKWAVNVFSKAGPNQEVCPECCSVVPVLYRGPFLTDQIDIVLRDLAFSGSVAAPGFPHPEGIVIHHLAGNYLFKKTIANDSGKPE